ncbi:hypothetical protein BC936DRAFT_148570 [Jimgerdemannia flammicorona]|uniref:Uncharacterized protein n=1 Tax=Jimgerdemannia flammicorona TaxID=994334 RepID=A0A433DKM4_9FUNG|nr:hypothetical protein BC936DRAFT_148570 [Jimgerdemannia flammicorona]
MPEPYDVISICLKGATMALAIQALWDVVQSWNTMLNRKVLILKIVLIVTLTGKAFTHVMFNTPLYDTCYALSKVSGGLYHVAMTAANWILLSRATLVIVSYPRFATGMEYLLVTVRIVSGVFATIRSYASPASDGSCIYHPEDQATMFYSVVDLFVDVYVTISITLYLKNHWSRLHIGELYSAVISSNLLRTMVLLLLNTATIVVNCLPYEAWQQIVWEITNIAYILTVVYDADMIKMMAGLKDGTSFRQNKHGMMDIYMLENVTSLTDRSSKPDKVDAIK